MHVQFWLLSMGARQLSEFHGSAMMAQINNISLECLKILFSSIFKPEKVLWLALRVKRRRRRTCREELDASALVANVNVSVNRSAMKTNK